MSPTQERRIVWAVLGLVLVVNAAALSGELQVGRLVSNDTNLHLSLVKGMTRAIENGQNPLDFWAPGVSFGSAPIRTYQPLAHLLVTLVYFALGKTVPLMTVFLWTRYLAVVLLPAAFFGAALLLEFPPAVAAIAAVLAPLISTAGWYGLDYSSYLTLGRGLFAQSVASLLLLPAVGYGYRAVRHGRSGAAAGILLGLTCVCHFIYGWLGAVTLCLIALLPDPGTALRLRIRRLLFVGCVAIALSAFQLAPVWQDRAFLNHSRMEGAWKWDSFGAGVILRALTTGELLDHGRPASLSTLALLGAAWLLWRLYRTRKLAANESFVLAAATFWLLVFFGRPTWGSLLLLIGAMRDLHLHRVVGALHIFLIFLAAIAIHTGWRLLAPRGLGFVAVLLGGVALAPMLWERSEYLALNSKLSQEQLAKVDAGRDALDGALADVRQAGGRVYAGSNRGWGPRFERGGMTFAAFLNLNLVPQASDTYHNVALTADLFPLFDEANPAHYRLFGVRSVVAPDEFAAALPGFLTLRRQMAGLRIFNAPGTGYFDIVDAPAAATVDRDTFFAVNERWLQANWADRRAHLWLDLDGNAPASLARVNGKEPLPSPPAAPPPGEIRQERQDGDDYAAEFTVSRPSYVLFRMTWHPNWAAYVDGKRQKIAMLSPGFTGVPVSPGQSRVVLRYEPGWGKIALAVAGLLLVLIGWGLERRGAFTRLGFAA